ncbi:MAG: glycosyltransferase family 2 protein [Candidatus Nanopelagicales bacterium]
MTSPVEAPQTGSDETAPEVTFVLPCLNEAESLGTVLREITDAFATHECTYEIVVADNGSVDGSQQIASEAGARVVAVPERGYGAALLGGIAAARGQYIVMGDADGSYQFADSWPMIEKLRAGCDLVMGNRFEGGIADGAMPWLHRYVGNPVLSFLGRVLFASPVRDFHCGLRAFNRSSIDNLGLSSPGMEFASEMVVLASRSGLDIAEVPVRLEPDLRSRPPHLKTWRDGWRHLRFLFAMSPSWAFLVPAVVAGLAALVVGLISVAGPVSAGDIEFSYKTSIVAAAISLIAVVAAWSFVLARAILGYSTARFRYATEIAGAVSILVFLVGGLIVLGQFIRWGETGFGLQPIGKNLTTTVWGSLLMAAGGTSFFFSLLSGLVRTATTRGSDL